MQQCYKMNNEGNANLTKNATEKCDVKTEDSQYSKKPYEPMMYCYENLASTPKRVFEDIVERYQNFVQEVQLDNN